LPVFLSYYTHRREIEKILGKYTETVIYREQGSQEPVKRVMEENIQADFNEVIA
jgi:hypothetical protein